MSEKKIIISVFSEPILKIEDMLKTKERTIFREMLVALIQLNLKA